MTRSSHLFALLAAAVVLPLFAACGSGSEQSDGTVTISFWHFWSDRGQKEALLSRIREFEKVNPDIHVEVSDLSWNDGKTKLLAAFSSNTAPDVLELGSDWVAQFSAAGVLADLAPLGATTDRFDPAFVAPGRWGGRTLALPWVVDTRVLFVNHDLLGRAGLDTAIADTTWTEVLAHAESIRAAVPDAYGFGVNGEDQHRLYKKVLPFFWSNGGQILDERGQPAVNSPQNVEALEMYLTLARSGIVETQKQLDQMFLQGRIGYWISGSWLVERIAKDNPALRYSIRLLPGFAGKPAYSFAGGEYLSVNASSKQSEAAMKLVTFLSSAEQALAFAKELPGGVTPADLKASQDAFLQGPIRGVFTQQLKRARMTPVHPRWLDIEEVIENEVAQALLERKTAAQALQDAHNRVTAIVQDGSMAEAVPAE